MGSRKPEASPSPTPLKYADFNINYIWVALAIALFAGFAIGAHLSFVIGFDFSLGDGFVSYIQTHGHAQLLGWAGLFIMGISLHFLPRLTGVAFKNARRIREILWLMTAGLGLRIIGHSVLPYFAGTSFFNILNWIVAASSFLQFLGIVLYLSLIFKFISRSDKTGPRKATASIAPFIVMMLAGWFLYGMLNFILLLQMSATGSFVLNDAWNEFAVKLYTGFVLLPVSFAFSIRSLPLYLRLKAPTWNVRRLASLYFIFLLIEILPSIPALAAQFTDWSVWTSSLGSILKGGVILWIIWEIDLLTRRDEPWTVNRVKEPGPDRRPTRPGLPDYGEFGKFELLIYAAYFWLALAAVFEIVSGLAVLLQADFIHLNDAIRHMYLLGFITNLILGMSVRMIPGFIHKRKIALPKLVLMSFWLVNIAAVTRILPLMLPLSVLSALPFVMQTATSAFALSGIFGILAVLILSINLWKTAHFSSSDKKLALENTTIANS